MFNNRTTSTTRQHGFLLTKLIWLLRRFSIMVIDDSAALRLTATSDPLWPYVVHHCLKIKTAGFPTWTMPLHNHAQSRFRTLCTCKVKNSSYSLTLTGETAALILITIFSCLAVLDRNSNLSLIKYHPPPVSHLHFHSSDSQSRCLCLYPSIAVTYRVLSSFFQSRISTRGWNSDSFPSIIALGMFIAPPALTTPFSTSHVRALVAYLLQVSTAMSLS